MIPLSDNIIQAIATGVRKGLSIDSVLEALDIPTRTFHQWMSDASHDTRPSNSRVSSAHKQLAVALVAAVTRARAEREAELVQRITDAKDAKGNRDWRADAFLLTHGPSRERWYEHRGPDSPVVLELHPAHARVRTLTDDELRAELAQLESRELGAGSEHE